MNQLNFFELTHPRYRLPERPRLFEAFAGNGIIVDVFAQILEMMK